MKKQKQTPLPISPGMDGVGGDGSDGADSADAERGGPPLLLSKEMCEASATAFFAHFTSKLIHSQASAVGIRVGRDYAKNVSYVCGARLLYDGVDLGVDYITQANNLGGKSEIITNPHLLRVLDRKRKEEGGQEVKPDPKDDYSGAEMYAESIRRAHDGEIGEGLCPRCKQVILPYVSSEEDWDQISEIFYVSATPLSSAWLNGYFFERFFERSAMISELRKRLVSLLVASKKSENHDEKNALRDEIKNLKMELSKHARFREIMAIHWPVGGEHRRNVTGYYQRMAFSTPPEFQAADRTFFSVMYGGRAYGDWDKESVDAYLKWESKHPEQSRGDSLALDHAILGIFHAGISRVVHAVKRDHHACLQAPVYREFLDEYRRGITPKGVRSFYAKLVFGDFSDDFFEGLATQLVNRLEKKVHENVGLSERMRLKLHSLFKEDIKGCF